MFIKIKNKSKWNSLRSQLLLLQSLSWSLTINGSKEENDAAKLNIQGAVQS